MFFKLYYKYWGELFLKHSRAPALPFSIFPFSSLLYLPTLHRLSAFPFPNYHTAFTLPVHFLFFLLLFLSFSPSLPTKVFPLFFSLFFPFFISLFHFHFSFPFFLPIFPSPCPSLSIPLGSLILFLSKKYRKFRPGFWKSNYFFCSRSFSNSLELVLTSWLLYLVAHSMRRSDETVYLQELVQKKYTEAQSIRLDPPPLLPSSQPV